MIAFEFELDEDHPLGLGHMTVRGPGGDVSSRRRTPDGSMMLFHSIGELVSTVNRILTTPRLPAARFDAVDSSFGLRFERSRERKKQGQVAVLHGTTTIAIVSQDELRAALVASIVPFARKHWRTIATDPAVLDAMKRALQDLGHVGGTA